MSTLTAPQSKATTKHIAGPILLGLAASLTTAALLWLSHFPVQFGWLAWFALVPWLLLVRSDLGWKSFTVLSWLGGYLFLLPAISWMRVAHEAMVYSWLALSWYCSWYVALAAWLIRRFDRRTRWPLCFTVPVVWTACEYARGTIMGGFPWYFLAHSQHDMLPVIQIADVGGAWAVSFLVAAVNGLLVECLLWRFAPPRAKPLRPQLIGVGVLVTATLGYGFARLATSAGEPGPTVALLQTDLAQGDRNAADDPDPEHAKQAQMSIAEQTFKLSSRIRALTPRPDLAIWPETTFELDDIEIDPDGPFRPAALAEQQQARNLLVNRTQYVGTNVLYGLNTRTFDKAGTMRRYNAALLLKPDGERAGHYFKSHLVPFGEYVPLREELPWMDTFAPYAEGRVTMLSPGRDKTRLRFLAGDGREFEFGVVICYEDSYGAQTHEYVRPSAGRPVDFLVNITNDGWFYPTSEHEEHLAISRFRAVECRRALVRSVNMGISAVIDGNGRVVALPRPTWSQSKGVLDVVTAVVPIDTRTSVYASLGDWLPWACCGLVLVLAFTARRPPCP